MQRVLLILTLALAEVPAQDLPAQERAWIASKLYASIQQFWAHRAGAPDLDIDREYKSYLSAAMTAADRRAFDMATLAFVGKLRNGHSGFYDKWLQDTHGQPLGLFLMPMKEGWVVFSSRRAGIEPGDIVVAVDGTPTEEFYRRHEGLIEGSSDLNRRRAFPFLSYLWPDAFTLELNNGRKVTVDRKQKPEERERTFPFSQGAVQTPNDVGYLRIRSFEEPGHEQRAIQQMAEMQQKRVLIFDVRGNGGGSTPEKLIARLMNRPWSEFHYTTPLQLSQVGAHMRARVQFPQVERDPQLRGYYQAMSEFAGAQMLSTGARHTPDPNAWGGKVLILIDGACASACEDFVQPFKSTGRGTLIGDATFGSSGQPYYYDFGNGMSFRLSSMRFYMPDGKPFEGVGIEPDVSVTPTLEEYRAGRDPVLEKALAIAAIE